MPLIYILEDDDSVRELEAYALRGNGYEVGGFSNPKDFYEAIKKEKPDLVVADVMLPGEDGLSVTKKLRASSEYKDIPIVIVSAKDSEIDAIRGFDNGADDYITKPFSATYLKLRVHNIINQRQAIQARYLEQLKPEDNKSYRLDTPEIRDADSDMMKSLLEYLEKHISDPNLRIEDLADAVNLGRTVFYGKIKSIVGMSPVDFLRHIRMQRAE